MALNKRQKAIQAAVQPGKAYAIDEALKIVKDHSKAKFVEAVDVAVRLGVDAKKSDQQVRGSTVLPAGTGKTVRVAVFCPAGAKADEALAAGADAVGMDDLAEKMQGGEFRHHHRQIHAVLVVCGDDFRIGGGFEPQPFGGDAQQQDAEQLEQGAESRQIHLALATFREQQSRGRPSVPCFGRSTDGFGTQGRRRRTRGRGTRHTDGGCPRSGNPLLGRSSCQSHPLG